MTLRITRLNGTLGARVEGIDFAVGLDRQVLDQLAAALWAHQVIAMPARHMTPQQHLEIALHFGEPEHNATEYFQRIEGVPHITVVDSDRGDRADSWHADETFLPAPPMVNLLHARQLPACGGDTAFISARAAYAALSDRMKTLLDGLRGEHDLAMTYEAGWRAGLPLRGPASLPPERYLELMRVDKKAQGGEIRFVLIEAPGRAVMRAAPDALVREVLAAHSG